MKTVFAVLLCMVYFHAKPLVAQVSPLSDCIRESLRHLPELPETTELGQAKIIDHTLFLQFHIPLDFLHHHFEEHLHEEMVEHFATSCTAFSFQQIELQALNAQGEYQLLSDFLEKQIWAPMTLASNADPFPKQRGTYSRKGNTLANEVQPQGGLEDKTIWLSAGHGWKYDNRRKVFKTQRHNSHGLVEDFTTAEGVNYHLLKYLYQAGANVWTVRERDMNEEEIIIDNDLGKPYYKESGSWAESRTNGYRGKTYRYAISNRKANAAAHFIPDIQKAGKYWVSVHYVNGTNRSVDTRYKIIHAGGESMVSINQEVHGNTWVYLGQFYFEKGNAGKVVLINQSSESGQAIIADAVRFGGGKGTIADCDSGRKSGEPRYEEAAKYYAPYQGFPYCLNDVMIRPHYAEWELAKGTLKEQQNSVYISWHTNASPNRQSGSESFIHSRRPVQGSSQLQKFIHREMIGDIRKEWDTNWNDRGVKSADFGELRGLKTMPGVLLEVAFHDHPEDARALSTPAFRHLVARSVYKGITRYFAARQHRRPVFLPEPPSHVSARNKEDGEIQLDWEAPVYGGIYGHEAKEYKIYYSLHPKGFAESVKSKLTTFSFTRLQAATTYYFRIVAINEGGESFPSAVVAARTPDKNKLQQKYLIVDGFDRLDKGLAIQVKEKLPDYAPLGNTRRLFLEQMNNYDYAGEHARALALAGVYFDGTSNEAVENGRVNLRGYDGIDWYLGRESTADKVLSALEIQMLRQYLDQGGNLIISGSELAYALDFKGQGRSFYRHYLKAQYLGDDAGQSDLVGSGIFARLDISGGYLSPSPDFVQAHDGGVAVLKYRDGKVAAIAFRGKYGLLNFAFPLEAIGNDRLRGALLQKAIAYFNSPTLSP